MNETVSKKMIEKQIAFCSDHINSAMHRGIAYGMIEMAQANKLITDEEFKRYKKQLEQLESH